MLSAIAASALEVAINQCLSLALNQYPDQDRCDPERQRLQALDGKVIAIDLEGPDRSFYLIFNAETVHVQGHLQGPADARISGTPLSLLRMGVEDKPGQQQSLFSGAVRISGDAELGRQVSALLDGLDIDWEEHLSHVLGDVLAHELGSRVRELGDWARQALGVVTQNSTEYLHEEARLLAPREELEAFLADVDVVRNDMARLQQRFERLQLKVSGRVT